MALGPCFWGLESSCSLFADSQGKKWHLWNDFLISGNIPELPGVFYLGSSKELLETGSGLCLRQGSNTQHKRKMIFPVITHWQMPCLVFSVIPTERGKLANPWSDLPKHPSKLTQAWLGSSSSTTGSWKENSLAFLFVTREESLKTRSDLKSVHEPAKPQRWCSSLTDEAVWEPQGGRRGRDSKIFP